MSYRVTNEILERSDAELADRLVLLAIGEIAHHDGVGWLPQSWQPGATLEQQRRTIRWRARCSERQVRRSVATLESAALDELESRTAQVGRKRILVYRVTVGKLRELEVDYERIPYALDRPFSTADELLLPWAERPANLAGGQLLRASLAAASPASAAAPGRPDNLSAGDDRPSAPGRPADLSTTTGHLRHPTRAHDSEPSMDPSIERSSSSQIVPFAERAAAAVDLNEQLIGLGVSAKMRMRACAEPDRAAAWLTIAAAEADTNPAGFFRVGFESGEWPSARENARSGQTRNQWLEQTSWRLDADEAHYIVDGWGDLDAIEKTRLHERVDEIRAERVHQVAEARTA